MGGGGGGLLRAAHSRRSVHQAPDTEGAACCLHCRAPRWNELSPVSPVFGGLSPVRPGTEKANQDKDLGQFRPVVPGVPGVLRSHPEAKRQKVLPGVGCLGVRSAAVAGKFPAGTWGVVLCPGWLPSAWYGSFAVSARTVAPARHAAWHASRRGSSLAVSVKGNSRPAKALASGEQKG